MFEKQNLRFAALVAALMKLTAVEGGFEDQEGALDTLKLET